MSGEIKTEAEAEGMVNRPRFVIKLDSLGEEFMASLKPVTRDVWRRRLNKGRMSEDHAELFKEMFEWWKKENNK